MSVTTALTARWNAHARWARLGAFIYLTALESGHYNAATSAGPPVDVKLVKRQHWRPENFTHQTYGPVPVVRALAESLNLATVSVG